MNDMSEFKSTILENADRCVKCGLCSAQCPTYLISESENESPRGRISLAQAIASGRMNDENQVTAHINSCLTCQRCEKICPSGVEFGEIISKTRHILNEKKSNRLHNSFIRWIANRTHSDWRKISRIMWGLNKTGFFRFFSQLSPIQEYITPPESSQSQSEMGKTIADVSLFSGCTSQLLDADTIHDAQQLLRLCGFNVSLPENQVCCGALPHHKGLLNSAAQCEKMNTEAFTNKSACDQSPILFLATACGASLKNYDDSFRARTFNINQFLLQENALDHLQFNDSKARILIHSPCSEKNALNEKGVVERLLSYLPGAEIISLKETTSCCGAAGDYMISHAHAAIKIREPLLKDILSIKPDVIVTSNYTCGIHTRNGLQEKNLDIPVMHPIRLLLSHIKTN